MADNKRTGLSALADAGNEGEDFSVIDAHRWPAWRHRSMLPGRGVRRTVRGHEQSESHHCGFGRAGGIAGYCATDSAPVGNGRGLWSGGGRHLPDLGMADS